jgi:hypothetical protein
VLAEVVIVAVLITGIIFAIRSGRLKPAAWTLWVACGALVGAALAGPVGLALWLLPAALCFGAAGVLAGIGGLGRALRRFGLVLAAALVNFIFLWSLTTGNGRRLSPEEFQATGFRVHSFLADVELHDVWIFNLPGGPEDLTLRDAQESIARQSPYEANTAVALLVGVRMFLGGLLGWDDDKYFDVASSYTHRLTADDRERTLEEPGSGGDMFKTVYAFENEMLAEMMNRTAHAFFCMAMEPAADGYRMYWAIYVRETSALTPYYMALIDPFRRHLVYPSIVHNVERAWAASHTREAPR